MPVKIADDEPELIKPKARVHLGKVKRSVVVDPVERARTKKKLDERRQTGYTTLKELRELSLITDTDIQILEGKSVAEPENIDGLEDIGEEEEGEWGEGYKPSTEIKHARQYFHMSLQDHAEDEKHLACPHTEDTWCTCERRLTGITSTFVDKNQPPYTIWHAGTDYASPPEPVYDDEGELEMVPVEVFNMTGEDGFCVQITNYGARIVSILMPDFAGVVDEVMLSYPNIQHLEAQQDHYLYGILGRVAGTITDGVLSSKNVAAQLELNNVDDHLNGGSNEAGFDRMVWKAAVAGNEMVFTLLSRDGTAGYPGNALLTARYSVRPPNTLVFRLTATCTKPCPFLPALRIPFNLAGHGSGKMGMLEHVLKVNASRYFATDKDQNTTGKERHVAGTIYDLRIPRAMKTMHPLAPWPGYRTFFRLDNSGEYSPSVDAPRPGEADDEDAPLPFAAKLYHPESRRAVELRTNQPVLYFETAHTTMPVDEEDEEEEESRKWQQRYEETRAKREEAEAAAAAEAAKAAAAAAAEDESEGEEDEESGEDSDEPISEFGHRKTRFGDHETRVMEEVQEPTPPQTPVQGRGQFFYYRCCAVTLQPQADPLAKPRKNRDGTRRPMDVTKLVLRPGRQLVYALTMRFYVEEPLPKPRRKRGSPVRLEGSDERLEDVRARFDECNVDPELDEWRRAQALSYSRRGFGGSDICLLRDPKDMQADRCSVESLLRTGPGIYDRVFLGPPTAEVPEPKRKEFPPVEGTSPTKSPRSPRSPKSRPGWIEEKEEKEKKCKDKQKKKKTSLMKTMCPAKRPFGYSPA